MPNRIDSETYREAARDLPDIRQLVKRIDNLHPVLISMKYKPDSYFPVALACFQDSSGTLQEARYALLESLAHKIWYLERIHPPDEAHAVFFSRFYTDDAALRLYSAAEHLAKAVVYIFDISDAKIKSNRTGSRFNAVRQILAQETPSHPVSLTIDALYNSTEWQRTIEYRNIWVHQQPPIVKGTGITYKRERRWKPSKSGNSYELGIGGGDEAEYSIDDLLGFIRPALFQFTVKLAEIVEFYISELVR